MPRAKLSKKCKSRFLVDWRSVGGCARDPILRASRRSCMGDFQWCSHDDDECQLKRWISAFRACSPATSRVTSSPRTCVIAASGNLGDDPCVVWCVRSSFCTSCCRSQRPQLTKRSAQRSGCRSGAFALDGGRLRKQITRSAGRRVNGLTSVPPFGSSSRCHSCPGTYSLGSVLAGSDKAGPQDR